MTRDRIRQDGSNSLETISVRLDVRIDDVLRLKIAVPTKTLGNGRQAIAIS